MTEKLIPTNTRFERFIPPDSAGLSPAQAIKRYVEKMGRDNISLPSNLKKIINPYELFPGDILLVKPKNPTELGLADKVKWQHTVTTQNKLIRNPEHAAHTHVAISRGYHEIYESIPLKGVHRTTAWQYMNEKYDVKVRRLKIMSSVSRSQVAMNVAELLDSNYGYVDLARVRAMAEQWSWLYKALSWSDNNENYICSALFAASCEREGIDLQLPTGRLTSSVVTPAHLSAAGFLQDVELSWIALPPNINSQKIDSEI